MSINTLLASVKWYPVLFDSALNAMRSIAFWLTVAIAIAFVYINNVLYIRRYAMGNI